MVVGLVATEVGGYGVVPSTTIVELKAKGLVGVGGVG